MLPFFETVFFPFVKEICLRATEIDNFRTTVSVFLLDCAFLAIICVRNAGPSADHAPSLVGAVIALVADPYQSARPHVRIADDAFTVAFFTQSPNRWKQEIWSD